MRQLNKFKRAQNKIDLRENAYLKTDVYNFTFWSCSCPHELVASFHVDWIVTNLYEKTWTKIIMTTPEMLQSDII